MTSDFYVLIVVTHKYEQRKGGEKNSKLAHTNFTNRVNWDGLLSTGK